MRVGLFNEHSLRRRCGTSGCSTGALSPEPLDWWEREIQLHGSQSGQFLSDGNTQEREHFFSRLLLQLRLLLHYDAIDTRNKEEKKSRLNLVVVDDDDDNDDEKHLKSERENKTTNSATCLSIIDFLSFSLCLARSLLYFSFDRELFSSGGIPFRLFFVFVFLLSSKCRLKVT